MEHRHARRIFRGREDLGFALAQENLGRGTRKILDRAIKVSVFARDFDEPRWLAVAPKCDVFVADAKRGQVIVLRDTRHLGKVESREIFADHLTPPFGIAFHEGYVYIGTVNEVIRFRFDPKISKRLGGREHILDLPRDVPTDLPPGIYAHCTRAPAFSHDRRPTFEISRH